MKNVIVDPMSESHANILIPSADQLGANELKSRPDVKVPSKRSAPPQRITQSQKRRFKA